MSKKNPILPFVTFLSASIKNVANKNNGFDSPLFHKQTKHDNIPKTSVQYLFDLTAIPTALRKTSVGDFD